MYTQCPHCLSVFVLQADGLASAHGQVRCGHCEGLFDALPTLCEALPPPPFVTLPRQDGLQAAPRLQALVATCETDALLDLLGGEPAAAGAPPAAAATDTLADWPGDAALPLRVDEVPAAPHAEAAVAAADGPAEPAAPIVLPASDAAVPAACDTAESAPDAAALPAAAPAEPAHEPATPLFAQRARGRWRRRLGWTLVAVLLLALLAQGVWIARAALLPYAAVRTPLLAALQALHLPTPQRADAALLQLDAADIRPLPGAPGVLLISASIHNRADWTQPYPALQVTLSNLAGKPVAARVFAPAAYLPDAALAAHGLPAGARAAISLEVRDPGRQAVAFAIAPR